MTKTMSLQLNKNNLVHHNRIPTIHAQKCPLLNNSLFQTKKKSLSLPEHLILTRLSNLSMMKALSHDLKSSLNAVSSKWSWRTKTKTLTQGTVSSLELLRWGIKRSNLSKKKEVDAATASVERKIAKLHTYSQLPKLSHKLICKR